MKIPVTLLWFAACFLVVHAESSTPTPVSCTIVSAAPIEAYGPDGALLNVTQATVGLAYQCLRVEGTKAVLQDASGHIFKIRVSAVSHVPLQPVADTPTPPALSTNTVNQPPLPVPAPSPAPIASTGDAAKIGAINQSFGLPLFTATNFWKESASAIAKRFNAPRESFTTVEASYRSYDQTKILGATAYSIAIYGKTDPTSHETYPTSVSIIFSNAGDFAEGVAAYDAAHPSTADPKPKTPPKPDPNVPPIKSFAQIAEDLEAATKKDELTITDALTSLLGSPSTITIGNSSDNRETMKRWDYQGTAFLLSSRNRSYTSIKLIPSAVADNHGMVDVAPRSDLKDILAKRVHHYDNGDVLIDDIPMVDQGPHGYCVPATWERYLRYVDVPADLYELAQLGHSDYGGATHVGAMAQGIDTYVYAYHRRIESENGDFTIDRVGRYIDKGLPLMWGCFVVDPVENQTTAHTIIRASVTDWKKYAVVLHDDDLLFNRPPLKANEGNNGHLRMIVGYNPTTKEIAISDSWGEQSEIRWMYLPTAIRISQGNIQYISW